MRFLKVTYVDAITGISIAKDPAFNGPKLPEIAGLEFVFARESHYPTPVPEFFCTCDDDADLMVDGVLDVLTEDDFEIARLDEMRARKPKVLTPRQARLVLAAQPSPDPDHPHLLAYVEAGFAALPEPERSFAKISWEYATEVRRGDPLVAQMAEHLGLTEEQIDGLFAQAATL